MGQAAKVFEWISIVPHSTVGVWIHGYSADQFVTYSITANLHANEPSGAVTVRAKMSIEDTGDHVDGTIGRLVYVTNNSIGPQAYISCQLNRFAETIR